MIFKRLKKSTKEEEEQFANMLDEQHVDAKDKFAMIISGCLVVFVPCVIFLLLFAAFMLWLIGAF